VVGGQDEGFEHVDGGGAGVGQVPAVGQQDAQGFAAAAGAGPGQFRRGCGQDGAGDGHRVQDVGFTGGFRGAGGLWALWAGSLDDLLPVGVQNGGQALPV
jgi:hypothetical protein